MPTRTVSEEKLREYENIIYECIRCGNRMTLRDLYEMYENAQILSNIVQCSMCNYNVLRKVRSGAPKRVKAI